MLLQIRNEKSRNCGAAVIGLSAYPDEVVDFRDSFERAGVLIVNYDDAGSWRAALGQTISDVLRRRAARHQIDFLILTALEEERAGFDGTGLAFVGDAIVAGLNVRYVELAHGAEPRSGAIIKLRQMGLVAATLDASLALSAFDARVICMSGICAGFSDRVTLGQLVLASPAWEYQAGKWSDNGFQIAPTQIPLPSRTRVIADQVLASPNLHRVMEEGMARSVVRPSRWAEPTPAPAATGSAVIADSSRLDHIKIQHRKIATLDMETFGLYYAAHEVGPSPEHWFSLKCVVDMADVEKGDDLHEYGCGVSARATLYLISQLLQDPGADAPRQR
jgi:nucleoside phosphorylase